ncbi:hypothetical protein RHGRI_031632 [Rhododendron griersonianum]|uniref:Uncharacterized protein n=1 Tax=Rhododendron griersonianum TaxID=479676 RepID=A0AAV6I8I8_9ERIC|nr:hypothetical protein RHGRI_031632 [Rhododendron griersonianum]
MIHMVPIGNTGADTLLLVAPKYLEICFRAHSLTVYRERLVSSCDPDLFQTSFHTMWPGPRTGYQGYNINSGPSAAAGTTGRKQTC